MIQTLHILSASIVWGLKRLLETRPDVVYDDTVTF